MEIQPVFQQLEMNITDLLMAQKSKNIFILLLAFDYCVIHTPCACLFLAGKKAYLFRYEAEILYFITSLRLISHQI